MHRYFFHMQKAFLFLIFLLLPSHYTATRPPVPEKKPAGKTVSCPELSLYREMKLENILNYEAFLQAIAGYNKIEKKKKEIITVIDFTRPSTEKRFYVLDLKHKKLLFHTLVSHGKNSGGNYATSFSNQNGSYKSSLGFYRTENTYQGKNGYSLILEGLEKGINDRAKERAIVVHGAPYSNPSVIASGGRLGRSFGCPALPQALSTPIINTIKGGSLLFIYANNSDYLSQSTILSTENSISPKLMSAL